jgi:hypothetical protein
MTDLLRRRSDVHPVADAQGPRVMRYHEDLALSREVLEELAEPALGRAIQVLVHFVEQDEAGPLGPVTCRTGRRERSRITNVFSACRNSQDGTCLDDSSRSNRHRAK